MLQNTQVEKKRVSSLGIASVIIAVLMGLLVFILTIVAGVLEESKNNGIDEDSPLFVLIGLLILGAFIVNLFGAFLGFAGVFQDRRGKFIAALGAFLNLFAVLGIIGVIILGVIVF